MKLTPIKANMTELEIDCGKRVLFSYKTPVAAIIEGKLYRTSTKWSQTTTRHINKYLALLDGVEEEMPQSFFDELARF